MCRGDPISAAGTVAPPRNASCGSFPGSLGPCAIERLREPVVSKIHLWADENLLDLAAVDELAPQPRRPLLVTMNCLNGYFHFPYFDSLSEKLLKAEGRGVVAAFSPSGLSLNGPAQRFHKLLLKEIREGGHARLGNAVLKAQQAYVDSGALPELVTIYHLLGDPTLPIR